MPKPNDMQVGGTHYQGEYTQQHWDYAWERGFDYFQYVITKYVERHKLKNGLEDLRKAQHYLAKYIELLEGKAQAELEERVDAAAQRLTDYVNKEDTQWTEEEREKILNTEFQNDAVTNTPRGPDDPRQRRTAGTWHDPKL